MTAVDILENKTEADAIALFDGFLTFREFMDNLNKSFEKAKEMEKQQIIDAFEKGQGVEIMQESNKTWIKILERKI